MGGERVDALANRGSIMVGTKLAVGALHALLSWVIVEGVPNPIWDNSVKSSLRLSFDSPLPEISVEAASEAVHHAVADRLEIDFNRVDVSSSSDGTVQHRRIQSNGQTSLTFSYMVACDSTAQRFGGDCGSIESALRGIAANPDLARIHAQAIIDAVAATAATAGYTGAVVSSVDDVVTSLTTPAMVSLTLPFVGDGVYSTNCDVSEMINLDQLDGVTAELGTTVDTATDSVVTDAAACSDFGCGFHTSHGDYDAAAIVDNNHSPASWAATPYADSLDCGTRAYVTVNLGEVYPVGRVIIWHFYGNTRAYCGQKLALSPTGEFAGEETVVMETGTAYGDNESPDGNTIEFDTIAAQYVRHWSSRSTANTGIHFMEIDVYGCPVASTMG
eukprot:SAG31_NODE_2742_length_5154_cov_4.341048_1_plen_388_part_00